MVAAAIDADATHIMVAAGGSATTDGGAGAVQAIHDGGGLRGARITVLSDVTTTFLDAPRVFGPQKGAGPAEIEVLERRLRQLAGSYPRNPAGVPRTGAAGGAFRRTVGPLQRGACLRAGAVLDAVDFDRCLASADAAVVVGEGRLDSQTGQGKIVSAILERVQESGRRIPVVAVVGSVAEDLGSYAGNFTEIIVASDSAAMFAAGRSVAGYSASRPGRH